MISYYEPDIVTAQDYYPFGMLSRVALPNSGVPYKFGFNGQMMNNDVKGGLGNSYTAQFWEYDSRIGRRWNLDPKPLVSLSQYSAFSNNPIMYNDPLGDSIPTKFYGKDGKQTNEIPSQVQKMYNEEWGIKVGYANGKLFKVGEVKTEKQVSKLAKDSWDVLLGKNNTEKSIIFGHDLTIAQLDKDGNVLQSSTVNSGISSVNHKNAFIDLEDFEADGRSKEFEYPKGLNLRAFNMARVLEHEYLGHTISECLDIPNNGESTIGPITPGPNEDNLNVMRRQMGLPLRITYSGPLKNPTDVGIKFGVYDKRGIAIPQFEVKYKRLLGTGASGVILNSETGEEIK